MCMDFSKKCECGKREASFHFQDNLMPVEVISRLYCPECDLPDNHSPVDFVKDNGWGIEYDMEVAFLYSARLPKQVVDGLTAQRLFDEGYASWRGIYPGDHIDSLRERQEIVAMAKTDPEKYMHEIRDWANARQDRLAAEGWRKASA